MVVLLSGKRMPPAMKPGVLLVCRDARGNRVGPPGPPQLRWHVVVVQVGMITAVAADELERIGVAAFRPARHDVGRPAPKDHRPAKPWSIKEHHTAPTRSCSGGCRRRTTRRARPRPWRPPRRASGQAGCRLTCRVTNAM